MRLVIALGLVLLSGCELFAGIPSATLAVDGGNENCATGGFTCSAPTPVCDLASETCVECLDGSTCPGQRPFCDTAVHTCDAGCTKDSDCPSDACLPDRTCAVESQVKYAAPFGAGDCSRAMPCAIETAVAQLGPGIDVIQLAPGAYDLAGTLQPASDVTFNGSNTGAGALIRTTGGTTGITVAADRTVQVHRVIFETPNAGTGVICQAGGTINLVQMRTQNSGVAMSANMCTTRIDRSSFTVNALFAMSISGGTLTMTSSFVTNNGSGQVVGAMLLDGLGAASVIEHCTIAGNVNNGSQPSSMRCTNGSPTFRNNIIRNNSNPATSIDPLCVIDDSVIDAGYTGTGTRNSTTDPLFLNAGLNDYHLMTGSPVAGTGVPSTITFFDVDGDPRPEMGNPDPGADEIP